MFSGVFTALVTPFKKGRLDKSAFKRLIDFNFENGVTGIVPCGTTGESPTLTHDEHHSVVEWAVAHSRGRGPVIAGTGSNSTEEAVSLTRAAEKAGADASLQVCPYYNKPSQDGLYAHFRAIARATRLPIILYSVPGRTGIEIGEETCARLAADCRNIVAIKEAGGSVERVSRISAVCPRGFAILSGDDSLTLPFMAAGALGVISVASNLVPAEMTALVQGARDGRFADALAIHRRFYPLFSSFLKLDTNPVPIKTALALAGRCSGELRLPLVPMTAVKRAELERTMAALDLM